MFSIVTVSVLCFLRVLSVWENTFLVTTSAIDFKFIEDTYILYSIKVVVEEKGVLG